MKTKCLSAFLTLGVVSIAAPGLANSPENNTQLNFACEMNEGLAITIVKSETNEVTLPVFLWKPEVLNSQSANSPEQLCNNVSEKLNSFSAGENNLSNINFIGTEQGGLPVICANTGGKGCDKILLTLGKTTEPAMAASDVVDSILAKNLQPQKTEYSTRGVQSISYKINFLSLLF